MAMSKKKRASMMNLPAPMQDRAELLGEQFIDWAMKNGVNLDHESDWRPWWECYLAGADAEKLLQIKE